ncbi:MAG: corrinoid protein [Anaerolineales bacterium]|nr:corrinoid protein [Anaerolineales bacterium]
MTREEEVRQGLFDGTLYGKAPQVKALTEEALALGLAPLDILFGPLIPALEEVGRRFEVGEYFVPEMIISAKAMGEALKLLRPLLAQTGAKPIGTVVILTVKGDMHDIGKNLCIMMLEGAGFNVVDLGVNTSLDKLLNAVREHRPQLVGFSAFLTTTMPMFKTNLEALAKAGLRDNLKVMVGGAPVTQEYADKVGADGYAATASATVTLAKELMVSLGYDISASSTVSAETEAAVGAMETLMDTWDRVESRAHAVKAGALRSHPPAA